MIGVDLPETSDSQNQRLSQLYRESELKEYLDQMVVNNLRLVLHVTKGFRRSGVDRADLLSAGCIGLMKAARTFDSDRKARFSTYACICIRNEILQSVRKEDIPAMAVDYSSGDIIKLLEDVKPRDELEKLVDEVSVNSCMRVLSFDERRYIRDRYFYAKTQSEISREKNVSQSYVSRYERRLLEKLKELVNR